MLIETSLYLDILEYSGIAYYHAMRLETILLIINMIDLYVQVEPEYRCYGSSCCYRTQLESTVRKQNGKIIADQITIVLN